MTLTIQIGNSDDKLTQARWAEFVRRVDSVVQAVAVVHFSGSSAGWKPWQNHCWVCVVGGPVDAAMLRHEVIARRREFGQESVAWTEGGDEFV